MGYFNAPVREALSLYDRALRTEFYVRTHVRALIFYPVMYDYCFSRQKYGMFPRPEYFANGL